MLGCQLLCDVWANASLCLTNCSLLGPDCFQDTAVSVPERRQTLVHLIWTVSTRKVCLHLSLSTALIAG